MPKISHSNNPGGIADNPANKEDPNVDLTLRPTEWDEYIGQEKIKDNLKTLLSATTKRGESADHLLFSGPAGLGKTTLAYLVAHELGAAVRTTSGPALEKTGDLAAILTNLTPHEVKTIITRAGENTKIIFTGDIYQIDTPYLDAQSNGLSTLIDKVKKHDIYAHVRHGVKTPLANN